MKDKSITSLCTILVALAMFAAAPFAAAGDKGERVGFFIACYDIGGNLLGAPLLNVHLGVNTPAKTVTGLGHITKASIHPPLKMTTHLDGSYTYMTVMPRNVHILVTATGYPPIHWPPYGGVGPVISPNVDLQMVLKENWKSGTANYKYADHNGNWHNIKNAPVKSIPCNALTGENATLLGRPLMGENGILLSEHFTNRVQINGELAWFMEEDNSGSTGYTWGYTPDNSGVYELVEEILLHASVPGATGVPGQKIWKFKAVRAGTGGILFELYPPGQNEPVKTVKVTIEAVEK